MGYSVTFLVFLSWVVRVVNVQAQAHGTSFSPAHNCTGSLGFSCGTRVEFWGVFDSQKANMLGGVGLIMHSCSCFQMQVCPNFSPGQSQSTQRQGSGTQSCSIVTRMSCASAPAKWLCDDFTPFPGACWTPRLPMDSPLSVRAPFLRAAVLMACLGLCTLSCC